MDASTVSESSSPPPEHHEHPSVRPVACLRCRNRRQSCSKEKPICQRCRVGAFECIYEESRMIAVKEDYLRVLEAKVKKYESTLAERLKASDRGTYERTMKGVRRTARPRATGTLITADGTSRRHHAAAEDSDEQIEDDHVLLGPFTQLSLDRPSTSFKGPGHSDYFLRNVRQLSGVPGDDGSLDFNPNFYDPGALPSRRLAAMNHIRLPPIDIARRLFAAQYTYIGTIFAFTDPGAFDQELIAAYRGQPDLSDKEACLAYAKVLLTLAFGQLYSVNQWIDFKGPPGFEYFTHALQLLPDAHEEGSILCVETLALVGYFMQNMNRRDAAFLYIGMALRMAISLGLHQEVKSTDTLSPEIDDAVREHRRRVWWSIYSLDRILSVKSGNPITIQDEDIGTALPSKLPGEADYCPAVVLRHYTELSRILGDITKSIYSKAQQPKSGRSLMASVQSIILSLSKWNQNLPDELRFEASKLSTNRESVSTFSHYYSCINMTARPLFFHVVQQRLREIRGHGGPDAKEKDWKEGLSQTTVRMIEMCVSAAQETVKMMAVAEQRDLVATYGYMDGEHIFSATIVLVMVCVAFPADAVNTQRMNEGLRLLRGMAERGNSHMGARYELLAHLRSTAMPFGEELSPSFQWPQAFDLFPEGMPEFDFSSPPPGSSPWSASGNMQSPGTANSLVVAQTATGLPNISSAASTSSSHEINTSMPRRISQLSQSRENPTPMFSMMDHRQLGEPFYDESMGVGTDTMLWEEGFANPVADPGFDLTQLARTGEAEFDDDNSRWAGDQSSAGGSMGQF
ncbi:fungal-specific transcription factor [Apodospora peruviana]|uniref:Fungal-specific transcription factor n=1 Tax=Apodospora peruviana TaxID=516989 RepID=A0AAE0LXV6_9PEZI|nr:fungal-specific transcription factor [Apodospora peruviana]KAK3311896.1 fungal-specific transcription factor [Apodospora peruviana]